MLARDYLNATDEQRSLILSQAELRLSDQHAFAQAADQRASTVTGALTALATAAGGVFAASIAGSPNWPLVIGGLVGALGFGSAARKALQSARCQAFHPRGYRPRDFAVDVQNQSPIEQTKSEMAEDLDERLEFNAEILEQRGLLIDQAMLAMLVTPALIIASAFCTHLAVHIYKALA